MADVCVQYLCYYKKNLFRISGLLLIRDSIIVALFIVYHKCDSYLDYTHNMCVHMETTNNIAHIDFMNTQTAINIKCIVWYDTQSIVI